MARPVTRTIRGIATEIHLDARDGLPSPCVASFDNVPVSLFLQDARTQVLPIHLWDIIQNQLDSRAASACGVIVITTALLLLMMERVAGFSRYLK